jgi:hypothetical protein
MEKISTEIMFTMDVRQIEFVVFASVIFATSMLIQGV